jgi:hypothetical protein
VSIQSRDVLATFLLRSHAEALQADDSHEDIGLGSDSILLYATPISIVMGAGGEVDAAPSNAA